MDEKKKKDLLILIVIFSFFFYSCSQIPEMEEYSKQTQKQKHRVILNSVFLKKNDRKEIYFRFTSILLSLSESLAFQVHPA